MKPLKDLDSSKIKLADAKGGYCKMMTKEEYYSLKPKYIKVDLLDFK